MLAPRRARFAAAPAAPREMPLGSGALAGLNWELDREAVAAELGFDARGARTRSTPSPAATSSLDYLPRPRPAPRTSRASAPRSCSGRASEFGFCEPADDFSSGSSIMPQKKNPDAAELLRAKAPRVVGVAA